MTLAFYPRGGGAQVARYLARALGCRGIDVTLCCGSLGGPGTTSNAETFFAGLSVHTLDFTEAAARYDRGGDPMTARVPMHPSFEDRPGVPDRVFTSLGDADYRRQVTVWCRLLDGVGPPDLYHVHHLTHVNDAVTVQGSIPTMVHLHGTELKLLDAIRHGAHGSRPDAPTWERRLLAAAGRANRLVAVSPADRDLAGDLFGIAPDSIDVVPNGVDTERFSIDRIEGRERRALWRRWLVEDPQGWDETGVPGSVRYSDRDLQRSFHHPSTGEPLPVLLYVGRFLGFKRVPMLLRAYAAARSTLGASAPPLVIWGGFPGEWEGDHPHTVATALGVDGVFFAGWRGHGDLSSALNAADVFVAPSVDEPFGQVYLEAMASGLPVIGTRSGGPVSFINVDPARPNGWLVTPDAEQELAAAMVSAISSGPERERRGRRGREIVERDFDWRHVARRFDAIYRETIASFGR